MMPDVEDAVLASWLPCQELLLPSGREISSGQQGYLDVCTGGAAKSFSQLWYKNLGDRSGTFLCDGEPIRRLVVSDIKSCQVRTHNIKMYQCIGLRRVS